MILPVLLAALMGLTSARFQGYFLPYNIPYLPSGENHIPYSSPIQLHAPVPVPLPVLTRIRSGEFLSVPNGEGVAGGTVSHIGKKERVDVGEDQKSQQFVSKTLTPADTVLISDAWPLAQRRPVFRSLLPTVYAYPQKYSHFGNDVVVIKKRVARQVFGSPVWDRKVVDWASKNCQALPVIGGAVAGASGGPVGVILGVIGAGIGSCNFNN